MKKIIIGSMLFIAAGCSALVLRPADFSWPVESVINIDLNGNISEERYNLEINIKPIFQEEFNDSNSYHGKEMRIIRDRNGYYFFTSGGFKNIYMFHCVEGGMELKDKLRVTDSTMLKKPNFNQKLNGIELIDGSTKYFIYGSEIVRVK